jgi:hypothetical protein
MAQQTNLTAVEWLIEQLQAPCRGIPSHIVEQAKQMEKEQIINAHTNGQAEFDTGAFRQKVIDNSEQYYNETYNK